MPARPAAAPKGVVGFLDPMEGGAVGGWVVDFARPAESVWVRVLIDGRVVGMLRCDLHREDARLLSLPQGRIGFFYEIPQHFHDGLRHRLSFATPAGGPVTMGRRDGTALAALSFCLHLPRRLEALVEGLRDGLVQGWALRVDDRAGTRQGGVKLLVSLGGEPVAQLAAEQYRADVAEALQGDAACGFAYAPPPEIMALERVTLRFHALPDMTELSGSPIDISFPDQAQRALVARLIEKAEALFSQAWHLRQELHAVQAPPRYLLGDYARWAADSLKLAAARAAARYGAMPECLPLVSVICPVFRPALGDFVAAVDSMRGQSFPHWELLLVDDGSDEAGLSVVLAALAAEPRIRVIQQAHGGIAAASNAGLAAARGRFVAFFDHDDVLEPAALEIMVRAQGATGARLLYSDEDKIDASGALSEPHFKPDFDGRLLLELNYICHLVLVETELARSLRFESAYDGAQDHDFLLRAVEVLAPQEIHHVPEVLYHWRKNARSTAADGSAKPHAAASGAAAVSAHLRRRRLKARVTPRENACGYRVTWQCPPGPAKITILIPFREQIAMTQACVAALRRHMRGVAYDIVLLDNCSVSEEAEKFIVRQENLPDTRVLRIAEPFNYARINNLGARLSNEEYLLFMNNDVIVSDSAWARSMLNECLADEMVGAVGCKLLYPNGTVQHAGVVLGVGGVADHAFRGIAGDAPGYVMRAMVARRVSAVTAACMLVRRRAFEAVGGFDAALAVAFNDVDLCLKLGQLGWKIVYAAEAVAEHHESYSRGPDVDGGKLERFMRENAVMRQRHALQLAGDPFYNIHFSRTGGVYRELRVVPPQAEAQAPEL
jgi:GT2 family glycosyltransferase